MSGPIFRFLHEDHQRLEALLQRAAASPDRIDGSAYEEFRAGLLKHIGMEEKILLPAAQRGRGGEPLPEAAQLRLDHGAIAALLVPSPTPGIIALLRTILARHNQIEESPGGVYEQCEQLAGAEGDEILARLGAAPPPPLNPHVNSPLVFAATRRALARAGYGAEADRYLPQA